MLILLSLLFYLPLKHINNNYDVYNGSDSSYPNTGSYPNVSPSLPDPDTSTDSWFQKLISMFNFNILNPFQNLYNSFTNPDSCQHIPIIAGMLHATSDTYCPWFPSSVRQLLTPVISISATMLLFGFFISWLKGSSGNFFEDTGHETLVSPQASGHWGRRRK